MSKGKEKSMLESQMSKSSGMTDWAQGMANTQLGQRNAMLDPLLQQLMGQQGGLWDFAMNGQGAGFSPEALTAMKGQAQDSVPGQYDAAMQKLKAMMSARGMTGGGNMAAQMGSLYGAREGQRADALRQIAMGNEQQKLANKQTTLGGLSSALGLGNSMAGQIGDIYNPTPMMNAAFSGLGQENSMTNARAQMPSLWQSVGMPLLGAGASVAGGWLGGLGKKP